MTFRNQKPGTGVIIKTMALEVYLAVRTHSNMWKGDRDLQVKVIIDVKAE